MYRVELDEHVAEQLAALPRSAHAAWRELRAALEVAPHSGLPLHPGKPDGVLSFAFGPEHEGIAYYLALEYERRVVVLEVQWLG